MSVATNKDTDADLLTQCYDLNWLAHPPTTTTTSSTVTGSATTTTTTATTSISIVAHDRTYEEYLCLLCGKLANNAVELCCEEHEENESSDEVFVFGEACLKKYLEENHGQCPITTHHTPHPCEYQKSVSIRKHIGKISIVCPRQYQQQQQRQKQIASSSSSSSSSQGNSKIGGIGLSLLPNKIKNSSGASSSSSSSGGGNIGGDREQYSSMINEKNYKECLFKGYIKDLETHLLKECNLLNHIKCEFSEFGCEETMDASNLALHNQLYMSQHLQLVLNQVRVLQQQIQSMKDGNNNNDNIDDDNDNNNNKDLQKRLQEKDKIIEELKQTINSLQNGTASSNKRKEGESIQNASNIHNIGPLSIHSIGKIDGDGSKRIGIGTGTGTGTGIGTREGEENKTKKSNILNLKNSNDNVIRSKSFEKESSSQNLKKTLNDDNSYNNKNKNNNDWKDKDKDKGKGRSRDKDKGKGMDDTFITSTGKTINSSKTPTTTTTTTTITTMEEKKTPEESMVDVNNLSCEEMVRALMFSPPNNLENGKDYLLIDKNHSKIHLKNKEWNEYKYGVYLLGKNIEITCDTTQQDNFGHLKIRCSHLLIYDTCIIHCNGLGFTSMKGPGHGKLGCGGGYGTKGTGQQGGKRYGEETLLKEIHYGSGGGVLVVGHGGGSGGGIIEIMITQQMVNHGIIQCNGLDGIDNFGGGGGGGGSGGSILIKFLNEKNNHKHIVGRLECLGGNQNTSWREGGLGRIAIYGHTIEPKELEKIKPIPYHKSFIIR